MKRVCFWFGVYFIFHTALFSETTLFFNGKILTLVDTQPSEEAMIVKDDRIIFVGNSSEASKRIAKSDRRIDLEQRRVLPGFIESHAHFLGLGYSKMNLDLSTTASEHEAVSSVKKAVAKARKGDWIKGRGWDQNKWPKKDFPQHSQLSEVSPDNPVVLTRVDGHAIWCNALAMKLAGIKKDTKSPEGGLVLTDDHGEPTGVFVDSAMELVLSKVPKPSVGQRKEAAILAQDEAIRFGVTSFHDAGVDESALDVYKSLLEKKKLKVRVYAMLNGDDEQLVKKYMDIGPQIDLYNKHLTVRAIKLYADGALGSRGAALIEPYSDEPHNSGLTITPSKAMEDLCKKAVAKGFQVATHAIGDRANRMVLDAYEKTGKDKIKSARFRIEHAQIVDPKDQVRFSNLGVIASMQPTHCTSDGSWVPSRLGNERAKAGAYVWKNFLRNKAVLAFGSDAPVESLNPLLGLYSAVTRRLADGTVFYPEQAITLHESIEAFTKGAAYAEFSEHEKGKLAPGYLADFIILDKDILKLPPEEYSKARVLETYIGGELVYSGL